MPVSSNDISTSGRHSRRVRCLGITVASTLLLSGCTSESGDDPPPSTDIAGMLETATVESLGTMLADGTITSEALAAAYVDRIDRLNTKGPGLRGVELLDPSWREQAQEADSRRDSDMVKGPLDGIPVLLKSNIDIDGISSTAGSVALSDNVAQSDAFVTTKLKDAGAVILGKSTMSEFAYWTGPTTGFSSLGGSPLNPYDTTYETSGSSSGPAVSAAAALATITVGTDTGGSVINPSLRMSGVAIRPTTGLISRTGIVPITSFSDTAGPMTRTVADAAATLTALAGRDSADPATSTAPAEPIDYTRSLNDDALQGNRIGVYQPKPGELSADQAELWADATRELEEQGAQIVPFSFDFDSFPFLATNYEFRKLLDSYLATRTAADFPIKDVPTLADFYRTNPADALRYGAETVFGADAIDLQADEAASTADLESHRIRARTDLERAFTAGGVDGLVFPDGEGIQITFSAPVAGYPEIAVSAGYTKSDRRPFGIVFTGKPWMESDMIGFAYDYEQASQLRKTPSEINPPLWRCFDAAHPAPSLPCLP